LSKTGKPLFREITSRGNLELLIIPFRSDEPNAEVVVDPEHTRAYAFQVAQNIRH
jgi:hypothetical protein